MGALLIFSSFFLWNQSLPGLLEIPSVFLGSLLVYVGLRHALLVRDVLENNQAAFLALSAGSISYLTQNPAIGLGIGLCLQRYGGVVIKKVIQRTSWSHEKSC